MATWTEDVGVVGDAVDDHVDPESLDQGARPVQLGDLLSGLFAPVEPESFDQDAGIDAPHTSSSRDTNTRRES